MLSLPVTATGAEVPESCFLMHSSGLHLAKGAGGGGVLEAKDAADPQKMTFIPVTDESGKVYYNIKASDGTYLSLSGEWDTAFVTDAYAPEAWYAIESAGDDPFYVTISCRKNKRYLGVDSDQSGAVVYSNKNTPDYFFFSDDVTQKPELRQRSWLVVPDNRRQTLEGWGVSLAWWANMCGDWSDDQIDRLVDWLVSEDGLNYRIFRYNIGGGDDPAFTNCGEGREHHMANPSIGGKGERAEMEGFKVSEDSEYDWTRDARQQKIMFKIKEKCPDAIFAAFSYSPPYWMTVSGCTSGNDDPDEAGTTPELRDNLKPEYYEKFAEYLVDVCKHFKEEGIEFKSLSPFNEPLSGHWWKGGTQEGCHFEMESQIKFIKILHDKLAQSGLNTFISGADETSVEQSVESFLAYKNAGVLDLVGRWNTHSYVAHRYARAQLSALCHETGKPLWMSKVGFSGDGLRGNINLASRLVYDMRFMMPTGWLDWQYVSENDTQWGMVTTTDWKTGADLERCKNYYVHAQITRFIKPGYTFITSLNHNSLAALSPDGKELVLVVLNPSYAGAIHDIDLAGFDKVGTPSGAYFTDIDHDMAQYVDYEMSVNDKKLKLTLPQTSVCTLVIPVQTPTPNHNIDTSATYLICPRTSAEMSLTAGDGVRLKATTLSNAQLWKFALKGARQAGASYTLTNLDGDILTEEAASDPTTGDRSNYFLTTSKSTDTSGWQAFIPDCIDDNLHHRIYNSDSSKAIDLEGKAYDDNTRIGIWNYAEGEAPVHRQWELVRIPRVDNGNISGVSANIADTEKSIRVTNPAAGMLSVEWLGGPSGPLAVYNVGGCLVYSGNLTENSAVTVDLQAGYYIVTHGATSVPVIVR